MSNISQAKPKVLVLLASRNGDINILQQLDSIQAQVGVELLIVIQDDNSSDTTAQFINTYAQTHRGNVQVFLNDVGTGSAGGNFKKLFTRVDAGAFDYIALADQDDIWLPDKLIRAANCLAVSNAGGYSAAVEAFWPDGRTRILRQSNRMSDADFLFEGGGQGCTFVIPAKNFEKVQDFCREHSKIVSKIHYHDWLIYLLIRAWSGTWYFDQNVAMRYRQHEGNEIGSRGSIGAFQYRIKKVKNGWYREQILCALKIHHLAAEQTLLLASFQELLLERNTFFRKIKIGFFLLNHSRRKFSERLFLIFCAVRGWI